MLYSLSYPISATSKLSFPIYEKPLSFIKPLLNNQSPFCSKFQSRTNQ